MSDKRDWRDFKGTSIPMSIGKKSSTFHIVCRHFLGGNGGNDTNYKLSVDSYGSYRKR